MENSDTAVDLYHSEVEGLDRFGQMLTELIGEILRQSDIVVHAVTYRVKSEESALLKLERKGDSYEGVGALNDLLGLRVICYFSDQVDQVASALQKQFDIDEKHSKDKRKALGDREFGYLSLHRIAKVLPPRGDLIEYKRFRNEPFEIQIRSILQHAWAEIEHDLGYKVETIPSHLRRRFSMLAGVLELADREFISLRSDVSQYELDSKKKATTEPDSLALDQSTLEAVLRNDPLFVKIDEEIAKERGATLGNTLKSAALVRRLNELEALGITDMRLLREIAAQRQRHTTMFAKKLGEAVRLVKPDGPQYRGLSLQYMILGIRAQALASGDEDPLGSGTGRLRNTLGSVWTQVVKELGALPAIEASTE